MANIDEIEMLAARLEHEQIDARVYLEARLSEALSPLVGPAGVSVALRATGDAFELFRAIIWLWAESLRRSQGRQPSDLVDSRLEVPAWDPDWNPAGD